MLYSEIINNIPLKQTDSKTPKSYLLTPQELILKLHQEIYTPIVHLLYLSPLSQIVNIWFHSEYGYCFMRLSLGCICHRAPINVPLLPICWAVLRHSIQIPFPTTNAKRANLLSV